MHARSIAMRARRERLEQLVILRAAHAGCGIDRGRRICEVRRRAFAHPLRFAAKRAINEHLCDFVPNDALDLPALT